MGADGCYGIGMRPREGLGGLCPPKNNYFHSGVVRRSRMEDWRGETRAMRGGVPMRYTPR